MPVNAAGFLDEVEPARFLVVNSLLSPAEQEITIAHENGHFLVSHKHLLSNHPWLRWINRDWKHPLAVKSARLFMESFNQDFDTEFFADLSAICQFSVMGRQDLIRAIVERNPRMAPWAALTKTSHVFLMVKRHFIPCAIRFFLFQIWI